MTSSIATDHDGDRRFRHLIGGVEVDGGSFVPNIDPSDTSQVVGLFAQGGAAEAQAAVAAAGAALPAWSASTPQVRFDLLDRAGTLILERREALGRLLAREEGKPLSEAIGEVVRAGHIFKFFAGEALRIGGEYQRSVRPGVDVQVAREPVGVVGLITPWNFPIAIPAWKVAPALAYGNTLVLKPAELTPACAQALVAILIEAGAPAGVVNLVMGSGGSVGDALVRNAAVDAVSFTGSVPTGRAVAALCAADGRRVQCEMGGKNAMVVLDDADLDVAVSVCINGAFFSTGQRCTASSRIIVGDAVHDRFVTALAEGMSKLRTGPALAPDTQIGPVVDRGQLDKNLSYLALAADEGARVVGGAQPALATAGFFLEPALFLDATPAMRTSREEIFGPIASVLRAVDDDDALRIANELPFGLSAGVCTTSLARARRFSNELQAGMVMVNLPTAGVDYHVPFGGQKSSSFGPREQGAYARDFYTVVKTVYVS